MRWFGLLLTLAVAAAPGPALARPTAARRETIER